MIRAVRIRVISNWKISDRNKNTNNRAECLWPHTNYQICDNVQPKSTKLHITCISVEFTEANKRASQNITAELYNLLAETKNITCRLGLDAMELSMAFQSAMQNELHNDCLGNRLHADINSVFKAWEIISNVLLSFRFSFLYENAW